MDAQQSPEQRSFFLWKFEAEGGDTIAGKASVYLTSVQRRICHIYEKDPSSLYERHHLPHCSQSHLQDMLLHGTLNAIV